MSAFVKVWDVPEQGELKALPDNSIQWNFFSQVSIDSGALCHLLD